MLYKIYSPIDFVERGTNEVYRYRDSDRVDRNPFPYHTYEFIVIREEWISEIRHYSEKVSWEDTARHYTEIVLIDEKEPFGFDSSPLKIGGYKVESIRFYSEKIEMM
tara:strand:- start:1209 stop:1529 length:321 start_codon:yes stop_codon:yes gene_type:complete